MYTCLHLKDLLNILVICLKIYKIQIMGGRSSYQHTLAHVPLPCKHKKRILAEGSINVKLVMLFTKCASEKTGYN